MVRFNKDRSSHIRLSREYTFCQILIVMLFQVKCELSCVLRFKICVRVIVIVVFPGENKVQAYFVGFAIPTSKASHKIQTDINTD